MLRKLKVSSAILASSKLTIGEVGDAITNLSLLLGKRAERLIPNEINDYLTLLHLIDLSRRLEKLRHCDGFNRHVRTYDTSRTSEFVTLVASYLLDKVDCVTLEPHMIESRKISDILAVFRGQEIYLECKTIHTDRFNYLPEHERMFAVLHQYVGVPHQIDIRYSKSLDDAGLLSLGHTLRERLGKLKGDGYIINNSDVEVQVTHRVAYSDKRLSLRMEMIVEDVVQNRRYLGHAFSREGKTMSIAGPLVDYKEVLRRKVRDAKEQSPQGKAYVLVIDGNSMLGDLSGNIRALSSAFQPEMNTRFSAALLVRHALSLPEPAVVMDFNFVANPFASVPTPNEFALMFRSGTGNV